MDAIAAERAALLERAGLAEQAWLDAQAALAVGGMAQEFTVSPDGDSTGAEISSSDGADEAAACASS